MVNDMKRYFLKYDEFLNEALPLSFAKKVNQVPRKENVEAILTQAFGNKQRIYLDLDSEEVKRFNENVAKTCPSYRPVSYFLRNMKIEIIDYVNNVAKEPKQKNFTKITKVLSKLEREDLLNTYVKDFTRVELSKNKEQTYKIVISKAKYDIAGMSTDRYWTSCMKLDVHDIDNVGSQGQDSGAYSEYVQKDIKEGTIIAYLISGNDTNINNPFGRVLIKPFVSKKKTGWFTESICYGNVLDTDDTFRNHFKIKVMDWVNETLNKISLKGSRGERIFSPNPNLYADRGGDYVYSNKYKLSKGKQVVSKFPNGNLRYITNHNVLGQKDGESINYYENGAIREMEHYKNGLKDGEYKYYGIDNNGKHILMTSGYYKNDKLEGEYKEWWSNGKPKFHAFYKDGSTHGKVEKWYENGNPNVEYVEENGRRKGEYKQWYENGKLEFHRNYDENGDIDGVSRSYYENGQLNVECNYKESERNGEYKRWHENGQLLTHCYYKDGREQGEYKQWYSDGTPKRECNYDNGVLEGEYKIWHENGQLEEHIIYKKGTPIGERKYWDEDGILKHHIIYDEYGNFKERIK